MRPNISLLRAFVPQEFFLTLSEKIKLVGCENPA